MTLEKAGNVLPSPTADPFPSPSYNPLSLPDSGAGRGRGSVDEHMGPSRVVFSLEYSEYSKE